MAMMALGAGLGIAGLAGAYASGSMGSGTPVTAPKTNAGAYQWGGNANALGDESNRLTGYEDASRAQADQARGLALGARGDQAALAARYGEMAAGRGPSLATKTMEAGLQQATGQAQAQAAATRGGGGNALLAQRNAQREAAGMSLGVAREAGQARVQEQLGAMAAQGGMVNAMRQGDLALRGQDQGAYQADMGARYGLQGQQLQANVQQDAERMRAEQWAAGVNAQQEQAARDRKARLWGSLMGGGGSMLGMGMSQGGGGGAPPPGPATYEDTWVANGGDPKYM